MRVVIQRVSQAKIKINRDVEKTIAQGLVVLLGIVADDNADDIHWLVRKIVNLRIFDDDEGVMNHSLLDIKGSILLVSQFTLHASTRKGNRPSYIKAANPEIAVPLYAAFIKQLKQEFPYTIETGEFGAHMDVTLTNDGPVTIIIDSKNKE